MKSRNVLVQTQSFTTVDAVKASKEREKYMKKTFKNESIILKRLHLEKKGWFNDEDLKKLINSIRKQDCILTRLCLRKINLIENEGVIELIAGALMENKSINFIDLRDNNIRDVGARAMAKVLMNNKYITIIHLSRNNISGEGLAVLTKALCRNCSIDLRKSDLPWLGSKQCIYHLKVSEEVRNDLEKSLKTRNSQFIYYLKRIFSVENKKREKFNSKLYKNGRLNVAEISREDSKRFQSEDFQRLAEEIQEEDCILQSLTIISNKFEVEDVFSLANGLSKNKSIRSISFQNNDIGAEGASAIAKALQKNSTVTTISLKGNKIGDEGAQALANVLIENNSIKSIDLNINRIGDKGATAISDALSTNNSITEIDLNINLIGNTGATAIAQALSINKSIVSIDLYGNKIGNEGASVMAHALLNNNTITRIDLSKNDIGDEGATIIAKALIANNSINMKKSSFPKFTTLQCCNVLELSEEYLSKSNEEIISYLKQRLLNDNQERSQFESEVYREGSIIVEELIIGDESRMILNSDDLKKLSDAIKKDDCILKNLTINSNKINDRETLTLANALEINRSITSINLNGNKIKDEGAISIARVLMTNTFITSISLKNNEIGNDGISAFSNALEKNISIRYLNLDGNNSISDDGAINLAKALSLNSSMNSIFINSKNISPNGASCIAKALTLNNSINLEMSGFPNFSSLECLKCLKLNNYFKGKSNEQIVESLKERQRFEAKTYKFDSIVVEEINLKNAKWFMKEDFKKLMRAISKTKCLLKNLFLNYYEIKNEDSKDLINALCVNNSITDLNFSSSQFGQEGLSFLLSALFEVFKVNRYITSLNLSDNNIEDTTIILKIAAIIQEKKTFIKNIDLSFNHIGDSLSDLANLIRGLGFNKTIATLKLNDNKITHEGADVIAEALLNNQSITDINLSGNDFGDIGTSHIARALRKNRSIQNINLNRNKIGSRGSSAIAMTLSKNSSLLRICIGENMISDDASAVLAKALMQNDTIDLKNSVFPQFNSLRCLSDLGLTEDFISKSNEEIINYLREEYFNKTKKVKRIRLMLIGSRYSGKTTLLKRLQCGTFTERSSTITDGIAVSKLTLDGIDFSVYDFAGKTEYIYTHSIFFDGNNSIFVVVYRRDSGNEGQNCFDNFLDMVYNCAPDAEIILVITFTDNEDSDKRILNEEVNQIKLRNPNSNIAHIISVDSKTGTGIEKLKKTLVSVALKFPNIEKEIPNSFDEIILKKLNLFYKQQIRFSISFEEFYQLVLKDTKLTEQVAKQAADYFCDWGILHRLSNNDLVLRPAQLANVLACVFTREETTLLQLGELRKEGLLRHDSDVLRLIWGGKYESQLWNIDDPRNKLKEPPFIQLLHTSCLAYNLYDTKGVSINTSLVSSLLPDFPCGFDPTKVMNASSLIDFYFSNMKFNFQLYPTVVLSFSTKLPVTFFSRLQVGLKYLQTLNGSWKNGCFLEISNSTVSIDNCKIEILNRNDSTMDNSYAIVFAEIEARRITIVSAGSNNRKAQSIVLAEIVKLKNSKYYNASLEWGSFNYETGEEIMNKETITKYIERNGYLINPPLQINNEIGLAYKYPYSPKASSAKLPSEYKELLALEVKCNTYLALSDNQTEQKGILIVQIQEQLFKCVQEIVEIMNLKNPSKCIKTLWLPIRDDLDNRFLLPLSPKSHPQKGTEINEWIIISDNNAKIEINDYQTSDEGEIISTLLKTCLVNILCVTLKSGWSLESIDYIEDSDNVVQKVLNYQKDNFVKLSPEDDFYIHRSFQKESLIMNYSPRSDNTMLRKFINDFHAMNASHQELLAKQQEQQKILERLEINLTNKSKEILDIVKDTQSNIEDSNRYFKERISFLEKIVKNLHKRKVPTTFLLLEDKLIINESECDIIAQVVKGSDEKNLSEYLKKYIDKMNSIFEIVGHYMSNPIEETKTRIIDRLQKKMYLYLMCECCFQPQQDGDIWPVIISQPKDIVWKILPLARAGLIAAQSLNKGLQIVKSIGFNVPSINDANFSFASDILNKLGDSSDYNILQNLVQEHCEHNNNNDINNKKNNNNNNAHIFVNKNDFSIQEFEKLMEKSDPLKTYEKLLQCKYNQKGDKAYICKDCCTSENIEY